MMRDGRAASPGARRMAQAVSSPRAGIRSSGDARNRCGAVAQHARVCSTDRGAREGTSSPPRSRFRPRRGRVAHNRRSRFADRRRMGRASRSALAAGGRRRVRRSASWCTLFNGTHIRLINATRLYSRRHVELELDLAVDDERTCAVLLLLFGERSHVAGSRPEDLVDASNRYTSLSADPSGRASSRRPPG